jgi:adenine deaminase
VPLTVCPLSNLKLCVFPRLADHNLKQLLEAGLCVTVNSDDPAYFGGYLNENFVQLADAVGLDAQHAYQLARNSFEASFVGEERKREYIAQLDAVFAAF